MDHQMQKEITFYCSGLFTFIASLFLSLTLHPSLAHTFIYVLILFASHVKACFLECHLRWNMSWLFPFMGKVHLMLLLYGSLPFSTQLQKALFHNKGLDSNMLSWKKVKVSEHSIEYNAHMKYSLPHYSN